MDSGAWRTVRHPSLEGDARRHAAPAPDGTPERPSPRGLEWFGWTGCRGRSGRAAGGPDGQRTTPTVFPRRLPGRSPRGVLRAAVGRSSGSGHGRRAVLLLFAASRGRGPSAMARFVSTTAAGQRRSRHEVWTGFPFQPPARATPTMHNISGYRSLSTLNVVVFRPLRHKGGWIGGAAAGWPGQSLPDTRLVSSPPGRRSVSSPEPGKQQQQQRHCLGATYSAWR